MKKTIVCLLSVLLLVACAPVQEAQVITTGSAPDAPSQVVQTELGSGTRAMTHEVLSSGETPDRVSFSVTTDSALTSKVTVTADAKVERPDNAAFPVLRIAPDRFTEEDAANIIGYFFGGSELYASDYTMTKSEIQERIAEQKEVLARDNLTWEDAETTQYYLDKLEEQYETAPEAVERKAADIAFETEDGVEVLEVTADLGYPSLSSVDISNSADRSICQVFLDKSRYYLASAGLAQPDVEMTADEARQLAEETVAELGYDWLKVAEVEPGLSEDQSAQGWRVILRRGDDRFVANDGRTVFPYVKAGDEAWQGDDLVITMDDSGITAFSWFHKSKLVGEVTDNADLLDFDRVVDVAKAALTDACDMQASAYAERRNESLDITAAIHRIALEYRCVPDDDGTYLLGPAWCFYGEETIRYSPDFADTLSSDTLIALSAVSGELVGVRSTVNE